MSFETTIRAFAMALSDPAVATPAMIQGRMGAPDARRFAIYRNNVAVGLIGALEARYPISRRIAGDELFRAVARAFVRTHRPRSPVMIAYGAEFPEFVAEYLAAAEAGPSHDAFGRNRHREERSDAAIRRTVGRSTTPTLPDIARLENGWVEAYHSEDASVATVRELAALAPDCLPDTRISFHPAARLMRFATPAATVWASAQSSDGPAAAELPGAEDALITRPDCDVRVRVLPPHAYDFALSLHEGATLIEAVATVNDAAFDFGTHLVGLVESGAVASIIPGRAP
jgi:hypothetical protein